MNELIELMKTQNAILEKIQKFWEYTQKNEMSMLLLRITKLEKSMAALSAHLETMKKDIKVMRGDIKDLDGR